MPTQARSAYGIALYMGDGVPLPGVAIASVTATAPVIVATASPHGIPVGGVDVVQITGVTGMTGVNGTWPVQATSINNLTLRGSIGGGSHTGGGVVVRLNTWHLVVSLTDVQDAGAVATLVDVSSHDGNGWSSRLPTFLAGNAIRVMYNLVPADYTHNAITGFPHLMVARVRRQWMLVFPTPSKDMWTFEGFVQSSRDAAPVAGALTAASVIEMTDAPLLALGTG